jgi:hypothetical protein
VFTVSRAFAKKNILYMLGPEPPSVDMRDSESEHEENLSLFLYAEHEDTWVGPRNPTGGLCSRFRGFDPYNSWLNSLIFN